MNNWSDSILPLFFRMKVFTDPGNFQTLKILVAGEIAGVKLEVKTVKSEGKYLPLQIPVATTCEHVLTLPCRPSDLWWACVIVP